MERFTLDFSLPNFITIGLIAAVWYLVLVGTFSVVISVGNEAKPGTVKAEG